MIISMAKAFRPINNRISTTFWLIDHHCMTLYVLVFLSEEGDQHGEAEEVQHQVQDILPGLGLS